MRGSDFLNDRRLQSGVIFLCLCAFAVIFLQSSSFAGSDLDDRITTGEDCTVSEKFSISFGEVEYFPENKTARLEIETAENINSTYLEKISLRGFEGNGPEKFPVIRSGNRTSRTGLIASTDNSQKAVGNFPLKPMNITIKGLEDANGNFSGLDSGDQIQLRYRQQYVAVKDFCHYTEDIVLFKLKENRPEIDSRI